jgi:glycosyltransferase involved in cell wall biosynthesis
LNFINRFKEKLSRKSQYDLQSLKDEIKALAILQNKLVICPNNTEENWLGIKNATLSMFPTQTFVIPQHFSNQIVSDHDLKVIIQFFKEIGGKTLILSGFPSYFFKIINICLKAQIEVEVIFHGGLAELNQSPVAQRRIQNILNLAKSGEINKIHVIKEGLDKLFSEITKIEVKRITPNISIPSDVEIKNFDDGKVHIGIFGNNSYNKNRHSQVAAAFLIPNSVIHIIGQNEFSYLLNDDRIVSHKQLNRKKFLELLGSMDINLHCSYTESWGQVTMESLILGVPCISGINSGLQNIVSPEFKKCFITNIDNPVEIANQIKLFI